jgi:hypothetical protein
MLVANDVASVRLRYEVIVVFGITVEIYVDVI